MSILSRKTDPTGWTPRRVIALAGICILLTTVLSCEQARPEHKSPLAHLSGPKLEQNGKKTNSQPNIILINLDDADRASVEIDFGNPSTELLFPNMTRLGREGLRFSNCHVAVPICGPSRACLLTGQYASRTGIRCNSPSSVMSRGTNGGYLVYRFGGAFGNADVTPYCDNDLPVWMRDSGYRTMFVGKYLHEDFSPQPGESFADIRPGGWDEFHPTLGGIYFDSFRGRNDRYGFSSELPEAQFPDNYRTDVEGAVARKLIDNHKLDRVPYFLYWAPFAPHVEAPAQYCLNEDTPGMGMIASPYKTAWPDITRQKTPDYNEADFEDKPTTMRQLPLLESTGSPDSRTDEVGLAKEYRRRMLSMRSVDDIIGNLLQVIDERGETDNTIIVLTSDHGYLIGEKRHQGKALPYNGCTNVPLMIWGPGYLRPNAEMLPHLISQVDLAPTLVEIAGGQIPEAIDGKSFLPLIDGSFTGTPQSWREEGILVEHWEQIRDNEITLDASFQQLRLFDSVYTEWADGDREFYDLAVDPWQLDNSFDSLSVKRQRELAKQMRVRKPVMPQPLSFCEVPFKNNDVQYRQALLTGLAEYSGGVIEVRLTIYEFSQSKQPGYWDGQKWVAERTILNADIANPGGMLTEWNYLFAPPAGTAGRYRVVARAVGRDGKQEVKTSCNDFSIDPEYPLTKITSPSDGALLRYSDELTVQGQVWDTAGARAARLNIYDPKTKLSWDGEQWLPQRTFVRAKVDIWAEDNIHWSYSFPPPSENGMVRIMAFGVNSDGKNDSTPCMIRFKWSM